MVPDHIRVDLGSKLPLRIAPPSLFGQAAAPFAAAVRSACMCSPAYIQPVDHSMFTAAAGAATASSGLADPLLLEALSTAAAAGAEACESSPWPVDDELGWCFSAANCAAAKFLLFFPVQP